MRVQVKLISLLFVLCVIFALGRYIYQALENKRMYHLFKTANEEKSTYFTKLIKTEGASLAIFVFDYTYWDEMVDFIHNNDMAWAKETMNETVLKTYKTDAIWIFNTDLSPVYSVTSRYAGGVKELPFPKAGINDLFLKDRLCHFFVNTSAGLMEIRGATVHPSSDPDRETPPQGYFFCGRLWKEEYVDELADLIEGEISISPTKEKVAEPKVLSAQNAIVFSKKLADWRGNPAAYIYVTIKSKELQSYKVFSRNTSVIFIIFLGCVIFFIGLSLAMVINLPLGIISNALREENPGTLRSLEKDTSEFGDIARLISSFFKQRQELISEIAERKKTEDKLEQAYMQLRETQNQLIQAEKLYAVGQLASGVAHEVRNPLAIILQGVDYLGSRLSSKERDILEVMATLKENINRADRIIDALFDFSRAASLNLQPEDINHILESSLNLIKARTHLANINITLEIKKDIPKVLADKNKLEQVFINILLNAIQAMPSGGKIVIRSFDRKLEEIQSGIGKRLQDNFQLGEKAIIVEVEDAGTGISDEHIKRIFDPFFTTKGPSGGAGLGLSVSRNIIHMHKGLIHATSGGPGKGAKMTVILKVAEEKKG